MKQVIEEDLILRRFLLGDLSRDEQGEVEERLFSDPDYFRQFRAAEDELIDEYLYGDLTQGERDRFENYFLTTPERRESLRIARALRQYIVENGAGTAAEWAEAEDAPPPPKKSFFDILRVRGPALRFSMAAAAVVVVAALLLLMYAALRKGPDSPSQASREDARPSPQQAAPGDSGQPDRGQVAQSPPFPGDTPPRRDGAAVPRNEDGSKAARPPRQRPASVYSLLILPLRRLRGEEGGVQEVRLPAEAAVLNLQVPLVEEAGFRVYQLALKTDDGREVKSWSNLSPVKGGAGQVISVNIPVKALERRKYDLTLSGVSDGAALRTVSTFHFQITK